MSFRLTLPKCRLTHARFFTSFCVVILLFSQAVAEAGSPMRLQLRSRSPLIKEGASAPDSKELMNYQGPWEVDYQTVEWDPAKTAVIVCDMWDKHWCPSAARRVAEMSPHMNRVIDKLREQGVLIIHSPSETMKHYEGTSQRRRAKEAPKKAPFATSKWYRFDRAKEPPLPIDDSRGGCVEDAQERGVWTRQIDTIPIKPEDIITDNEEAYHLMHQHGIENVIIMGVHANMCVLGRPFGIRNLVTAGKNVVLMRDMTDTMYNPARRPKVSHVRGTELVVEHIEKYWCPTITSTDVLGEPAFCFKDDKRPHVAILVSDDHYGADVTLPIYADELRAKYGCRVSVLHGEGGSDIHGMVELKNADCLIVFVRRLALPKEQLDAIRAFIDSGRPVIGLRTASHAFDTKGKIPTGCDNWVEFDAEVLGGNYHNHAKNSLGSDIAIVPKMQDHPLLEGVRPLKWHSTGSLYFAKPIKPDCTLLMTGTIPDGEPEPILWFRKHGKATIVYCALGHPDDFKTEQFRRLLANMVLWSVEQR